MKKTHKKILGFTGLGLVAAVTTVAATMPMPIAAATSSVTDTIQVTVVPDHPEITVTSESGSEITSPTFDFKVAYTNLNHIEVKLVNRDKAGDILLEKILWETDLAYETAEKDFNLNLDDYGGHGDFTITISGTGYGGVPVERILTVKYKNGSDDGGEVNVDPGSSEVDVETDIPNAEVKSVVENLYDQDGNLVKTITIANPSQVEILDFSDVPDGVYTLETISRDIDGNVIDRSTRIIVIDRGGGTGGINIPVEDPGVEIGKVVATVTDGNGVVKDVIEKYNPTPGEVININTDDYDPGYYTIKTDYYDTDGNLIKSTTTYFSKSRSDGRTEVPTKTEIDVVTSLQVDIYDDATGNLVRTIVGDRMTGMVNVYDANGRLLFGIPNGYRENLGKGNIVVSMEGLDSGDYTAVLMYKNQYGKIVGNTKTFKIKYDAGSAVIVPDTGGFFQGLNISREDYLITGVVVFAVIGVVAFGVVARKRSGKTTRSKSRK